MTRTRYYFPILAVWALSSGAIAEPPAGPNILVIVADDLGWADVGYHGAKIETPNIDRLSKEGVRLEQHYVQPMCSATRAALLSGRYPSRFGVLGATNNRVFSFDTVTLASALRSRGYDTGITGKWHLGSRPEWGPRKFGFNLSYGSLAGGVGQFNHLYKKGPYSRTWHRNDRFVDEEGHTTDLIAREAIRWIETERQGPFFIYVAFTAVHVPVEVPERWIDHYREKIENESYRRYAAYATHMDDAIGRIVQSLDRSGRRDDTLLVFFSDNGAYPSWKNNGKYPGEHPDSPVLGSNLPLRGYKGQLYEGGIRVVALANWPKKLPSGRVVNQPIHVVDWMPTFCRLAGYRPEKDLHWDGRDVWPLLVGDEREPGPRTLYWKFHNGQFALRHGDWKMILSGNNRPELYNLADDPYEKTNVAQRRAELVANLKRLLAGQRKLDAKEEVPFQ